MISSRQIAISRPLSFQQEEKAALQNTVEVLIGCVSNREYNDVEKREAKTESSCDGEGLGRRRSV